MNTKNKGDKVENWMIYTIIIAVCSMLPALFVCFYDKKLTLMKRRKK